MGTMLLPLYLLFLLVLTSNRIFSVKFCLLACTKFLTAYKLTISKITLDITSSILKSKGGFFLGALDYIPKKNNVHET